MQLVVHIIAFKDYLLPKNYTFYNFFSYLHMLIFKIKSISKLKKFKKLYLKKKKNDCIAKP